MTSRPHLEALETRHARAQARISEEISHPAHDGLLVSEMKRRKLALKDEIASLER